MFRAKWVYAARDGFEAATQLRQEVFVDELGYAPSAVQDENDPISACALIFEHNGAQEGACVATGRLHPDALCWKLGRICVRAPFRGQDYGGLVIRLLALKAIETAPSCLLGVDSALHAVQMYRSFGFEPIGAPFFKDGVPVQSMQTDAVHFNPKKQCAAHKESKYD